MAKHYINEVGTEFLFDTGTDLSSATFARVKWSYPQGNELPEIEGTWIAELFSSFSELAGVIGTYFVRYTIQDGDLDVSGRWKFQSHIGTTSGTFFSETVEQDIFGEFE